MSDENPDNIHDKEKDSLTQGNAEPQNDAVAFPFLVSFNASDETTKPSDILKKQQLNETYKSLGSESSPLGDSDFEALDYAGDSTFQVESFNESTFNQNFQSVQDSSSPPASLSTHPNQRKCHPAILVFFAIALIAVTLGILNQLGKFDSLYPGSSGVDASLLPPRPLPPDSSSSLVIQSSQDTTLPTLEQTTTLVTESASEATLISSSVSETTISQTTEATEPTSKRIPSSFYTFISDGTSDGPTASFNFNMKNTGTQAVSLLDGVESIRFTFNTNQLKIIEVTSPDFIFVPDPEAYNVFIGTPISQEVIDIGQTRVVPISARSEGGKVGRYTVNYYVKTFS